MAAWTPSQIDKLIYLVTKFPVLYKTSLKEYKDDTVKNNAFQEISNCLLRELNDVKDQWKKVRTKYTRERTKTPKKKSGDSANEDSGSTWPHMEAFSTIGQYISKRKFSNVAPASSATTHAFTNQLPSTQASTTQVAINQAGSSQVVTTEAACSQPVPSQPLESTGQRDQSAWAQPTPLALHLSVENHEILCTGGKESPNFLPSMEDLFPEIGNGEEAMLVVTNAAADEAADVAADDVPPKSSLIEEVPTTSKMSSNVTPTYFESKAKKQREQLAKKNRSREPELLSDARGLLAELANKPIQIVDNSPKSSLEHNPWMSSGITFGRRLANLPRRVAIELRLEFEQRISRAKLDALENKEN